MSNLILKIMETMGKVLTDLIVINRADQVLAENGFLTLEKVRTVHLKNVLVDTGVTTLWLSASVISQLGLKLLKQVDVSTNLGLSKANIFRDATIALCGRQGTFEWLEFPGGTEALLGVIPLEALGLDIQKQALKVLPTESFETYLTIL